MIEAVPQQEMINIPGLGPVPIGNLPAGMGQLQGLSHRLLELNFDACLHPGNKKLPVKGLPCSILSTPCRTGAARPGTE